MSSKIERVLMIIAIVVLFSSFFASRWFAERKDAPSENVALPQLESEVADTERVVEMETSMGTIKVKLFEDLAPKAVENFVTLSKEGYYDGITFHRVIKDFMIQSGDPTGTGSGGDSIYGGFFDNEHSNQLYHIRGALSMANAGPNSNLSQFFIVQRKTVSDDHIKQMEELNYPKKIIEEYKKRGGTPWLDGGHTVFGQVIEGMDVVDKIANVSVDKKGKPLEDVILKKVTVIK